MAPNVNAEWSNPRFHRFRAEVMKFQELSITELYILINRVTNTSKRHYFGSTFDSKLMSRLSYYRHWLVMLQAEGTIIPIPEKIQTWRVKQLFSDKVTSSNNE